MKRWEAIKRELERVKPRRIVEIGTCKGGTAEKMMRLTGAEYHGFDLFDEPPEHELTAAVHPWPIERVQDRLNQFGKARLYKGDTRDTLPVCGLYDLEFVFIDGGHSEATIRSDFWSVVEMMRKGGVILLDDYWNYHTGGCNSLVDNLQGYQVDLLEPVDEYEKTWGVLRTQIARVIV